MSAPTRVRLRPLREAEAHYVVDVCALDHCRGFVHTPSLEQVLAGFERAHAQTLVVEAHNEPRGFVRLSWEGDPVWLVHLALIAIAQPGEGYGRETMRAVLRTAFEDLRAHRMWLEVAAHNAAARALYERCGFVQEGLWRDGFREADGTYRDLAVYALLEREYASAKALS